MIRLDNESPGIYRHVPGRQPGAPKLVEAPDAVLVIINPVWPEAIDHALQARLEHFPHVNSAGGEVIEGVVILKDIGMSWETPSGVDPGLKTEIPLNLTPEEMEAQAQQWREGAERGYELGRRLGAKVTIACSRTGEGVDEAVDDVVMRVMEKRKAEEPQG